MIYGDLSIEICRALEIGEVTVGLTVLYLEVSLVAVVVYDGVMARPVEDKGIF